MADDAPMPGQVDANDVLLAIDNALVQVDAAASGLVLARRMVERLVGAEHGEAAEQQAEQACTHPPARRDETFGGWVCRDCGYESSAA